MDRELFTWSDEAHTAHREGRPLVALESTIIAHGLPYPTNIEVARELEQIVRSAGAVPATIAIQHGRVKIGLDEKELEFFARDKNICKVSRRDLPVVIAQRKHGATTVAATMLLAQRAGISVFATGGIGGVHRGGEDSLDVSADLHELAMSRVAVVSAGVKSILDIGRTLECLETLGVPIVGYRSDAFPAFYSRESGFAVPARCDTVAEIATMFATQCALELPGGLLIVNPIPARDEIPHSEMEPIIHEAERERVRNAIGGKDATPFLLAHIAELSAGRSLRANRALVANNARLAAEVAVALHTSDG